MIGPNLMREIAYAAIKWVRADEERKATKREFSISFNLARNALGGAKQVGEDEWVDPAREATEVVYRRRRRAADKAAGLRRRLRDLVLKADKEGPDGNA